MNNTTNKHTKQDQINQQQHQRQKTKQQQGPNQQSRQPIMLHEDLKHVIHAPQDHEHEHPETRLTR